MAAGMSSVSKSIFVRVKVQDAATSKLRGIGRSVRRFSRLVQTALKPATFAFRGLRRAISFITAPIRRAGRMFTEFRMELLSVMFAGMALNRVFMKHIRRMADVVGITDILGNAMKMLLLPVMQKLIEPAINILEAVGDLSEDMKELIGVVFIVASAFGFFLLTFGQLALFINAFGISILPLILTLGALGAAIVSVGEFMGFSSEQTKLFKDVLGKVFKLSKGLLGKLKTFLGNVFSEMVSWAGKQDWVKIFDKFLEYRSVIRNTLLDMLGKMFNGIRRWFNRQDWARIWSIVFDYTENAKNNLTKFLDDVHGKINRFYNSRNWSRTWSSMFEFTGSIGRNLADFLSDMINDIVTWSAEEANWHKIWDDMFEFTDQVQSKLERFMGQILGTIGRMVLNIDWTALIIESLKVAGQGAAKIQKQVLEFFTGQMHAEALGNVAQGIRDVNPKTRYSSFANPDVSNYGTETFSGGASFPSGGTYRSGDNVTVNVDAEVKDEMDVDTFIDEIQRKIDRDTSGRGIRR